jgi:hypothetical protein
MSSPVTLGTLITRGRQRTNTEGDVLGVTDLEWTDNLNVSLATEVYDLCRQAVGENYYRKPYTFSTGNSRTAYDLPADFLSLMSVDIYLAGTTISGAWKINARRYLEKERNLYQGVPLGWYTGAMVMYSTTGQQITFQQPSIVGWQVTLNYVPTSPKLGGGANMNGTLLAPTPTWPQGVPTQPCNYTDVWDDINGWSEIAVLDAARKCALKKNRLDLVQVLAMEKERLKAQVKSLLPLRNAGEPLRPQIFGRSTGQGMGGGGFGWDF